MIGARLGPYEITAKLGEGGMGEVYQAKDFQLGRNVALKVLPAAFTQDSERLARFEREARLLAQLNHPNIAQIYGFETSGETRALVMELVEGPTLAERLEQGAFSLSEALSVAHQIALALEEAHEKGIVHRDLKPQNIKTSMEGKTKVLDFGLAKAMDPTAGSPASASELARSPTLMQSPTLTAAHGTQLGVILGTAAYMAPEQARGAAVDKRADVWAFGVVLYEMLAGRSLFAAETVTDTLAGVLKAEVDFARLPPATPPAIRRLLRRCLERNPRNRLHDIADARIVLEEIAAGRSDEPVAGQGLVRPPAWRRWLPWAIAAAAALVAALLAAPAAGPPPAPVRSTIDLPSGLTLDAYDRSIALSPDGRRLVLTAYDATGTRRLFLRQLDALDVRPLTGTEDASYPFWSPDGRTVGFFSERKLRRFDLPDGPVRTICDAPAGRGATWGPNGTIVFAPAAVGGLAEVAAAGGTPRPFAAEPAPGVSFRLPQFLPRGDGLLYYAMGGDDGKSNEIHVVDAAGGSPRLLLTGTSEVQPAGPGRLAFHREGLLLVQDYDPRRRELAGVAVPIARDVHYSPDRRTSSFAFSPSGTLVYQLATPSPRMRIEWRDRQGAPLGPVGEPIVISDLQPSPDGQRALVWSDDPGQHGQLWMLDLARGVRRPFSPPGETSILPVWSPDSRLVAYFRYGSSPNSIVVRDADGDAVRVLVEASELEFSPSDWSPDGSTLLFSVLSNRSKQADIETIAVDGKSERRTIVATPAEETAPAFSPDGRWIAYLSDESGRNEIYLVAYPELGRKWPLTSGGVVSGIDWLGPTEIAYLDHDRRFVTIRLRFTGREVEADAPRPAIGDRQVPAALDFVPAVNRFLTAVAVDEQRPRAPLVLVTNWQAELER